MRILLIGEYSGLHNSLKEGLQALGHEVVLVGNGDGFKNFPADYSHNAKWAKSKLFYIPRQIIYKIFHFDCIKFEHGIRFYFLLPKFKGFDVVQFINESPIQTTKKLELYLLKKIVANNRKLFVLSSGVDYLSVQFLLNKKISKSILQPLFNNPKIKKEYQYIFEYTTKKHQKIHDFVYKKCEGIIATDIDYVLPLEGCNKFLGLIPNPINCTKFLFQKLKIDYPIIIFLGINESNYHQKGITYFEQALAIIKEKFGKKVEILVAKNIPYTTYINLYDKAHILLDQCFAYDQGYNALEAMAKGKVVFTGAEPPFEKHYQLTDKVAINAKPDVDYLVQELSFLIENPLEIEAIALRAHVFIKKEHDYLKIAEKYLNLWNSKS